MTESVLLIAGLAVLTVGANLLVRGASAIAARLGLSSLVIGLTVVAFGTSAPELAVSIKASLAGNGGIAVGNIVGSNIFNVALILGISALICPLTVHSNVVSKDMPIMLAASILFVGLLASGEGLTRWEGMLLLALLIVYVSWTVRAGTGEASVLEVVVVLPDGGSPAPPTRSLAISICVTLAGLAILVLGARIFVDIAVAIARSLGWSGNVVGSNIFNLLCIGGVTPAVQPLDRGGIGMIDLGAMLFTSLLLLPLMRTGFRLDRWEGGVLLGTFAIYLWLVWP